ncbi:MAG: UxaA family hydrolase [Candidatus Zipacnadales bacterium]
MDSTFWGFRRPIGRPGVRNHVLILPSTVCSCEVARKVATAVEGAVCAENQHGCSQIGADRDLTAAVLIGVGTNPNVFGVVVVGLGCEAVSSQELAKGIMASDKPVRAFDIQAVGGSQKAVEVGIHYAQELVEEAARETREEFPLSELLLGTECGGSDGWSGVTANPVIGWAADLLIAAGGTVILSETTEFIGAEHVLMRRARNARVAAEIKHIVDRMEQRVLSCGADIRGGNPTPGNMKGGITTLEEKSLGCIHKGGTSVVQEVVGYGIAPTRPGLVVMDTPGQDVESVSGMIAGGAQIVVFSTGRGSPVGSVIAPIVKVSTNTALYRKMPDNIDLDAGVVISEGTTVEEVGKRLLEQVIRVASGELTCSERLGHTEFAIHRIGPTV